MKTLIYRLYWAIDSALYKTFGCITPLRKEAQERQAHRLQNDLDAQHYARDRYNNLHGTAYTTKKAIKKATLERFTHHSYTGQPIR